MPRGDTEARAADAKQLLVVDSVDNMDGFERLVVICVGLDQVIDRGAGVLETRSRLYHAMTRAQLAVAVVNEVLPGGWLEFLGRVELDDEKFDDAAERENRAETAADDVVGAVVEEFGARRVDSWRRYCGQQRIPVFGTCARPTRTARSRRVIKRRRRRGCAGEGRGRCGRRHDSVGGRTNEGLAVDLGRESAVATARRAATCGSCRFPKAWTWSKLVRAADAERALNCVRSGVHCSW